MPNYTDVLQAAVERSLRYLHGIHDRRVAPLPEQIDRLHALAGPLSDAPTDPTAVLALLDEIGSPAPMEAPVKPPLPPTFFSIK